MASLLPGYKGLGGTAKKVLNLATGEVLSRRKYAEQIKRGGLKNEELAELNKQFHPTEHFARPAKGRKSIQKLAPEFKKTVAEVRQQAAAEKAKAELQAKKEKRTHKKIEQLKGKEKVKVPTFSGRLLKAGAKGRRIAFNNYKEYVVLRKDAEKSGIVFSYGLGCEGIDVRDERGDPKLISFTVFPLTHIKTKIDEEDFNMEFETALEEKAYFIFLHYWIHFAFSEKYYADKAKKAGIYKNSAGRTIKPKKQTKTRRKKAT